MPMINVGMNGVARMKKAFVPFGSLKRFLYLGKKAIPVRKMHIDGKIKRRHGFSTSL